MSNQFWSTVVPTAGTRPEMLRECLESVVMQGRDDLEVLLQSDGPVGSVPVVGPGGLECSLVYQECNPTPLGCYGTTNAALARARGEWVHVLHDDDWVLPGFYATMQRAVESLSADFVAASCRYRNQRADGSLWLPPLWALRTGPIEGELQRAFTVGNPFNLCAVVMRRSVLVELGGFRGDLPHAADWELYVRLVHRGRWWHEAEDLARYREHAGQDTLACWRDGRAEKDYQMARAKAVELRGER